MEWNRIYSLRRTGDEGPSSSQRTNFQRDFDRLVFSSAFRRLQNKTQVFPLPGSTFLHNRLTHSLEVASVGRSLGKLAGEYISQQPEVEQNEMSSHFYQHELGSVIAAACLAHDIGNPAFGHSGEKAISNYFHEFTGVEIEDGRKLRDYFSEKEWSDLTNFEGNANALRTLTHQFNGKSKGGAQLTMTTLAAIIKYPCEAVGQDKRVQHRKKYGFFQADRETAKAIFEELHLRQESEEPLVYRRHPFVFLTEAADDICYRIIDFEDAHRLKIISSKEIKERFIELIKSSELTSPKSMERLHYTQNSLTDVNEQIGHLRAKAINVLVQETEAQFREQSAAIIAAEPSPALLDAVEQRLPMLKEVERISIEKIYNHSSVVEIEVAGYRVMTDLLSLMVPAVLKQNRTDKYKKIRRLIPKQFSVETGSAYLDVMGVLDFVSGMTDPFAVELYRKLFGVEIPKH